MRTAEELCHQACGKLLVEIAFAPIGVSPKSALLALPLLITLYSLMQHGSRKYLLCLSLAAEPSSAV
jgi:hypothetical protein